MFHRLLENKGILVWDSDHEDYDDDAKALALFGTDQYVTLKASASCKLQSQELPASVPVTIPRQKVSAPTMSEICDWTPQKSKIQLVFFFDWFCSQVRVVC